MVYNGGGGGPRRGRGRVASREGLRARRREEERRMALLTTVRAHTRATHKRAIIDSRTHGMWRACERMCECARVRERSCIK